MNFFISNAFATTQPAVTQSNPYSLAFMVIFFVVIFYFMIFRPQQIRAKNHKKLMDSISKGDELLTSGGLLGKVIKVLETNYILMAINDNTEVLIKRDFITAILPKGTIKSL